MKRPGRSKSQNGAEVRQRPTSSAIVVSESAPEQFLRLPSGSCPVWETPAQVADAADSAPETPTWRKKTAILLQLRFLDSFSLAIVFCLPSCCFCFSSFASVVSQWLAFVFSIWLCSLSRP